MPVARRFMKVETVFPAWQSTTEMSGLSGLGGRPRFMITQELESFDDARVLLEHDLAAEDAGVGGGSAQ
jgi:hypothetical protein